VFVVGTTHLQLNAFAVSIVLNSYEILQKKQLVNNSINIQRIPEKTILNKSTAADKDCFFNRFLPHVRK
jgi:hypothetical protein